MKAIVVADDHYNGLGLIRSLGEEGVNTLLILLSQKENTAIEKSKYVERVVKVDHSDEAIIATIDALIDGNCKYYIFPLSDFASIVIDRFRNRWGENVVTHNAGGNIEKYENKKWFSNYVRTIGLNTPENIIITEDSSLEEWTIFPAIIKPLLSVEGQKIDISIVQTKDELEEKLLDFWNSGYSRVLLEQYIYGQDEHMVEVMGVSNGRDVSFARIIRKIREYPIQNGSTAFAELTNTHKGIDLAVIKNLILSVGYDGIFDVEFKYANGKAFFIELNFRNGAPAYVSTLDGFNLAYNWILLHSNKPLKKVSKGIRYFMAENRDILNLLKKKVPLWTWIVQFSKSKKIFFVFNDPNPNLYYYRSLIEVGVKKIRRR